MSKKRKANKKRARNECTSKSVARKASKLMRTSGSKNVRSVAASALTQAPNRKRTKGTGARHH